MKNFVFFLLLTGIGMTQGAQWLTRWQVAQRGWRLNYAVTQTADAKRAFAQANADNENALTSYDESTPEEREQTLIDAGLLSDQTAMCLRDPGTLAETPTARTPAELEAVAHAARIEAGATTVAMR